MAEPRADGPVVAIIPARGGSKRIPRKNIRLFLGVPLLARTIGILRESQVFDRIVVSTDDDEVAAVALDAGAEVPFRRPAGLADDHTPTRPVIEHAIRVLEEAAGVLLGPVACVYPAAVFLDQLTISRALAAFDDPDVDQVMTVVSFPAPIQRAFRRTADGFVEMIWPEKALVRSQDLEETLHDAGQLYIASRRLWLDEVPSPNTYPLQLDRRLVHDIDTEEDWRVAELAFSLLQQR